jgi:hypothetical protein
MLLKTVALQLSTTEYAGAYRSAFLFRTNYLSNFLTRHVRPKRFRTDGFNQIVVEGRRVASDSCPILGVHSACPNARFDQDRYDRLGPGEHHEFLIEMMTEGLEACARHHRIPLDFLLESIAEFRSGGCKNEWTHQSKLLRGCGLRATLLCSLDAERFVLTLRLDRKDETVFERPIMETLPDELIFHHRFKSVTFEGGRVVIESRSGKPAFTLDPTSLPTQVGGDSSDHERLVRGKGVKR